MSRCLVYIVFITATCNWSKVQPSSTPLPSSITTDQPDINGSKTDVTENATKKTGMSEEEKENNPYSSTCKESFCVNKCCPPSQIFAIYKGVCVEPPEGKKAWKPPNNEYLQTIYSLPKRDAGGEGAKCLIREEDEFSLQDDGQIYLKDIGNVISHEAYCIDYFQKGENLSKIGLQLNAVICSVTIKKSTFDHVLDKIHMAGCIITCLSLIALAIITLFGVKRTGDFALKSLLSMSIAMFFAYFVLIINVSPAAQKIGQTKSLCVAVAILQQFFFLGFYFWLSVRCFEIWRNVRGSIRGHPMSLLRGTNRRFLYYSAYAWGTPLIISSITAVMQSLPAHLREGVVIPAIGEGRCWFKESTDILFSYYYGFQTVLHISNVVFVAHAAYMMFFKRQVIKNDGEFHSQNRDACLKMFWQQFYILAVIVCIWSLDSASALFPRSKAWRVIDILNSLQGFFLLILVMIRDKAIRERISAITSSAASKVTSKTSVGSNHSFASVESSTMTLDQQPDYKSTSNIPLQNVEKKQDE